jgi:hypothetical protein
MTTQATKEGSMTVEEKAAAFDQMLAMMKSQRDGFRNVESSLGSVHSPETRAALAHLLDWFIQGYGQEKSPGTRPGL